MFVSKPKLSKVLNFKVDLETKTRLDKLARLKGMSLSEFYREAMVEKILREENKND